MIYLMGSLRNSEIPHVALRLRDAGHDVFSSWYAAGPHADDHWRDYEKGLGYRLPEALQRPAAQHVYRFDKAWLGHCETGVLVMPAGKSAFLELGWMLGQGKRGYILLDTPERWDVMFAMATGVYEMLEELLEALV